MTGALQLTNFLLKYSSVVVACWEYCGTARRDMAGKKRIRWEVVCMCGITALGMAVWYTMRMRDAGIIKTDCSPECYGWWE